MDPVDIEEMKKRFISSSEVTKPDDAKVLIAEMQLNALLKMSDDSNEIFSQIEKSEVFDVSRAVMFSRSALPSLSERLKKIGIDHTFKLPILEAFIKENFRNLHKVNRGRVEEYLKGLKSMSPTTTNIQEDKKPWILGKV
jgi:CMP-2-keto-3-deoxyoctulosonic acid synthetase